ncbi:MAG: FAD-dependent monooxygenase [Polyangiales bacterium]
MVQLGRTAVVVGASMAGLAAASVLPRRFAQVIVLERDQLPRAPVPRASIPQGRHVHALLAGGLRALEQLLPGLTLQLEAAGAVPIHVEAGLRVERAPFDPYPARDFGFRSYALSRPLLEHCVRERVCVLPEVTIEDGCKVLELVAADGGDAVTGVRVQREGRAPELLPADLVIDASGRGELTLQLLRDLGVDEPPATVFGIDQMYASAMFEIPRHFTRDWQGVMTFGQAPLSSRGALLLPVEGERWLLSVAGRDEEQPPAELAAFRECVRSLRTPTIFGAIEQATQLSEPVRFGYRESRRRHFERLARYPSGLLAVGDVLCRFNPIYAQGASVAAQEAVALGEVLDAAASLDALAGPFFARAAELVDGPWRMSAIPDLAFRRTRGERPADLRSQLKQARALFLFAAEDADAHRVVTEVTHLLKPLSALEQEGVLARMQHHLQRMAAP